MQYVQIHEFPTNDYIPLFLDYSQDYLFYYFKNTFFKKKTFYIYIILVYLNLTLQSSR